MLLARESNRFMRDDAKPWHLKASFRSFDVKGKEADHGTIEELWVSPTKYKIVRTTSGFSQTDYGTEKGILRIGEHSGLPKVLSQIEEQIADPVTQELGPPVRVDLQIRDIGGTSFRCLTVETPRDAGALLVIGSTFREIDEKQARMEPEPTADVPGPIYCLDSDAPVLRLIYAEGGISQTIRNGITRIDHRYIAHQIDGIRNGKKEFTAHLDTIEFLSTIDDAELKPPLDATPVQKRITISAATALGQLVKLIPPEYPPIARAAHVSGLVVVQAVIDKDGHVGAPEIVSGSEMLRATVLDAVKKWNYKPFLLNGEVVEARTTISVIFWLGRREK